jgi:hypothetical protein
MSFAGFMMAVPPVSRWWRRPHKIQITLWPDWLAQALCPHNPKTFFSEDKEVWRCEDCFKFSFPQAPPVVKLPNGAEYLVDETGKGHRLSTSPPKEPIRRA